MWICSTLGFFSIVKKDDGFFHVRARVRRDLETLCRIALINRASIQTWNEADYRFRILVNDREMPRVFAALLDSIKYSNFKSEIAHSAMQCPKLNAYSQLWHNLSKLQP